MKQNDYDTIFASSNQLKCAIKIIRITGNRAKELPNIFNFKKPEPRVFSLRKLSYKNKIIEPLHSRCSVIDFGIKGKEKAEVAHTFFKRLNSILEAEGCDADKKVLAELINKHFPDWRRVLNECQRYSISGKIDSGILVHFSEVKVNDLLKNLKEKNFPEVRKWVVDNLDNDPSVLLRHVYDALFDALENPSVAAAVLIIARYQYQIAFVSDQEINLLAALTEIMVECNFK